MTVLVSVWGPSLDLLIDGAMILGVRLVDAVSILNAFHNCQLTLLAHDTACFFNHTHRLHLNEGPFVHSGDSSGEVFKPDCILSGLQ